MALIIITVNDNAAGDCDVGVMSEPAFDPTKPNVFLTAAQQVAIRMLGAAVKQTELKQDRELIQLLDH